MTLSPSDLLAAKELCERATPGPWRWGEFGKERSGVPEKMMNLYSGDERVVPVIWLEPSSGWSTLHDNTEFIARARSLVPALLEEVERLRAYEARVEVAFRWIDYWGGSDQSRADADMIACGEYTVDEQMNLVDSNGKKVAR